MKIVNNTKAVHFLEDITGNLVKCKIFIVQKIVSFQLIYRFHSNYNEIPWVYYVTKEKYQKMFKAVFPEEIKQEELAVKTFNNFTTGSGKIMGQH